MCRHVLYERRSRTGQKLVPGPQSPQEAPVSVIRGAKITVDPTQGSGCVAGPSLPKIVTKDGHWTKWLFLSIWFCTSKILQL